MPTFTESELDEIYSELEKRRNRLVSAEKRLEGVELETMSYDTTEEQPPTRYQQADQATHTSEQERYGSLISQELSEIQDIEETLERIETGHYGICEECGKLISPARLSLMPTARFCTVCEAAIEKQNLLHRHQPQLERPDFTTH